MEEFESDVVKYIIEMGITPNFEHLLQKFVIITKEENDAWVFMKKDKTKNCQKVIFKRQPSIKCFTCFPNSKYYYCLQCFDSQQHINHKCVICDGQKICICWNELISQCSRGGETIPEQFKHIIVSLIRAIHKGYIKCMMFVQENMYKYDITVMRYFDISQTYGISVLQDAIPDKPNIKIYMNYFRNAMILQESLFKLFTWLVDQNYLFVFLITSILKEKLSIDSNQSILEDLFQFQIILDSQQPFLIINKLKNQYDILFADIDFKIYFQSMYLKQYKRFWLIIPHQRTLIYYMLQNYILKISQKKFQFNQEDLNLIINDLRTYIEELQFHPDLGHQIHFRNYYRNKFEDIQTQFLEDFNFQNILKFNTDLWNKMQSCKLVSNFQVYGTSSQKYYELMKPFRISEEVLLNQFWKCLGSNQYSFLNQLVDREFLINFKYRDFIFTAFIESFANVKPIKLNISDEDLFEQIYIDEDSKIYLKLLGAAVKSTQVQFQEIIQSKQFSKAARQNFCHLILFQSFNIIKEKRNKEKNKNDNFNLCYDKLVKENSQAYERLQKIYLLLHKNSTFPDKVFTLLLCYIYQEQQFNNPAEFIEYLLSVLDEDLFVLYSCLLNFISLSFNKQIGGQKKLAKLDSFDLAFIKIYLLLFGFQGFLKLKKMLTEQKLNIKIKVINHNSLIDYISFESFLLLRLLSSEICIYNVCGYMFNQLTRDLKLSLEKIFCQISYIYRSFPFEELSKFIPFFGVKYHSNTINHIHQVCKVNPLNNNFELKPAHKPIYDPAMVFISYLMAAKFAKKSLNIKNETLEMIYFGNGIEQDIQQFDQGEFRLFLYNYLQFYAQPTVIFQNLKQLIELDFSQYQCWLLNIQIVAANYLFKQMFQKIANSLVLNLQRIQDDRNIVKLLIRKILHLKGDQIYHSPSLFISKQNKLRIKYSQKQQKFNIIKPQFNQNLEHSDSQCSICNTSLDLEQACTTVNIFKKWQSTYLPLPYLLIHQMRMSIALKSCGHFYHTKCFEQHFLISKTKSKQCPICNKKFVTTLSLQSKPNFNIDVDQFQTDLLIVLLENGLIENYEDEILVNQLFILLCYLIIFDLICSLLHDPVEFKRLQKFIIFQQFIYLLLKTAQIKPNQQEVYFEQSRNTIYQLMFLIQKWIFFGKNYIQFQSAATEWLTSLNLSNEEIKQQFCACFNISEIPQQQGRLDKVDSNFIILMDLSKIVQEQIIQTLGKNFEEFYFRYFPRKCNLCNSYQTPSIGQRRIYICLLCLTQLCHDCDDEEYSFQNLRQHSKNMHIGNILYISLTNGSIILGDQGLQEDVTLYKNSLNENINIYQADAWNKYIINLSHVQRLATVIISNQYPPLLKDPKQQWNKL